MQISFILEILTESLTLRGIILGSVRDTQTIKRQVTPSISQFIGRDLHVHAVILPNKNDM